MKDMVRTTRTQKHYDKPEECVWWDFKQTAHSLTYIVKQTKSLSHHTIELPKQQEVGNIK